MRFERLGHLARERRAVLVFGALAVLVISSAHVRDVASWFGDLPKIAHVERMATALGFVSGPSVPITVIDIDETSWRAWERPFATPRDKIAELVLAVAKARPRAVLVDVDLSRADKVHDDALREAFKTLGTRLMLPREIIGSSMSETTFLPTPFEQVQNVEWVSVRFRTDDGGVVESWRSWEPDCTATPPVAVPSPQLNLALPLRSAAASVWTDYARAAEAVCKGRDPASLGDLSPEPTMMPFAFGDAQGTFPPLAKIVDADGRETHALIRLSADSVLKKTVAPELLNDRVVLIGASHRDSGDIHLTRYGAMPGVMILANAIALGPFANLPSRVWPPLGWAISMVIAGLAVLAFHYLRFFAFVATGYALLVAAYALLSGVFQPACASQIVANAMVALGVLVAIESIIAGIAALLDGQGFSGLLRKAPE